MAWLMVDPSTSIVRRVVRGDSVSPGPNECPAWVDIAPSIDAWTVYDNGTLRAATADEIAAAGLTGTYPESRRAAMLDAALALADADDSIDPRIKAFAASYVEVFG